MSDSPILKGVNVLSLYEALQYDTLNAFQRIASAKSLVSGQKLAYPIQIMDFLKSAADFNRKSAHFIHTSGIEAPPKVLNDTIYSDLNYLFFGVENEVKPKVEQEIEKKEVVSVELSAVDVSKPLPAPDSDLHEGPNGNSDQSTTTAQPIQNLEEKPVKNPSNSIEIPPKPEETIQKEEIDIVPSEPENSKPIPSVPKHPKTDSSVELSEIKPKPSKPKKKSNKKSKQKSKQKPKQKRKLDFNLIASLAIGVVTIIALGGGIGALAQSATLNQKDSVLVLSFITLALSALLFAFVEIQVNRRHRPYGTTQDILIGMALTVLHITTFLWVVVGFLSGLHPFVLIGIHIFAFLLFAAFSFYYLRKRLSRLSHYNPGFSYGGYYAYGLVIAAMLLSTWFVSVLIFLLDFHSYLLFVLTFLLATTVVFAHLSKYRVVSGITVFLAVFSIFVLMIPGRELEQLALGILVLVCVHAVTLWISESSVTDQFSTAGVMAVLFASQIVNSRYSAALFAGNYVYVPFCKTNRAISVWAFLIIGLVPLNLTAVYFHTITAFLALTLLTVLYYPYTSVTRGDKSGKEEGLLATSRVLFFKIRGTIDLMLFSKAMNLNIVLLRVSAVAVSVVHRNVNIVFLCLTQYLSLLLSCYMEYRANAHDANHSIGTEIILMRNTVTVHSPFTNMQQRLPVKTLCLGIISPLFIWRDNFFVSRSLILIIAFHICACGALALPVHIFPKLSLQHRDSDENKGYFINSNAFLIIYTMSFVLLILVILRAVNQNHIFDFIMCGIILAAYASTCTWQKSLRGISFVCTEYLLTLLCLFAYFRDNSLPNVKFLTIPLAIQYALLGIDRPSNSLFNIALPALLVTPLLVNRIFYAIIPKSLFLAFSALTCAFSYRKKYPEWSGAAVFERYAYASLGFQVVSEILVAVFPVYQRTYWDKIVLSAVFIINFIVLRSLMANLENDRKAFLRLRVLSFLVGEVGVWLTVDFSYGWIPVTVFLAVLAFRVSARKGEYHYELYLVLLFIAISVALALTSYNPFARYWEGVTELHTFRLNSTALACISSAAMAVSVLCLALSLLSGVRFWAFSDAETPFLHFSTKEQKYFNSQKFLLYAFLLGLLGYLPTFCGYTFVLILGATIRMLQMRSIMLFQIIPYISVFYLWVMTGFESLEFTMRSVDYVKVIMGLQAAQFVSHCGLWKLYDRFWSGKALKKPARKLSGGQVVEDSVDVAVRPALTVNTSSFLIPTLFATVSTPISFMFIEERLVPMIILVWSVIWMEYSSRASEFNCGSISGILAVIALITGLNDVNSVTFYALCCFLMVLSVLESSRKVPVPLTNIALSQIIIWGLSDPTYGWYPAGIFSLALVVIFVLGKDGLAGIGVSVLFFLGTFSAFSLSRSNPYMSSVWEWDILLFQTHPLNTSLFHAFSAACFFSSVVLLLGFFLSGGVLWGFSDSQVSWLAYEDQKKRKTGSRVYFALACVTAAFGYKPTFCVYSLVFIVWVMTRSVMERSLFFFYVIPYVSLYYVSELATYRMTSWELLPVNYGLIAIAINLVQNLIVYVLWKKYSTFWAMSPLSHPGVQEDLPVNHRHVDFFLHLSDGSGYFCAMLCSNIVIPASLSVVFPQSVCWSILFFGVFWLDYSLRKESAKIAAVALFDVLIAIITGMGLRTFSVTFMITSVIVFTVISLMQMKSIPGTHQGQRLSIDLFVHTAVWFTSVYTYGIAPVVVYILFVAHSHIRRSGGGKLCVNLLLFALAIFSFLEFSRSNISLPETLYALGAPESLFIWDRINYTTGFSASVTALVFSVLTFSAFLLSGGSLFYTLQKNRWFVYDSDEKRDFYLQILFVSAFLSSLVAIEATYCIYTAVFIVLGVLRAMHARSQILYYVLPFLECVLVVRFADYEIGDISLISNHLAAFSVGIMTFLCVIAYLLWYVYGNYWADAPFTTPHKGKPVSDSVYAVTIENGVFFNTFASIIVFTVCFTLIEYRLAPWALLLCAMQSLRITHPIPHRAVKLLPVLLCFVVLIIMTGAPFLTLYFVTIFAMIVCISLVYIPTECDISGLLTVFVSVWFLSPYSYGIAPLVVFSVLFAYCLKEKKDFKLVVFLQSMIWFSVVSVTSLVIDNPYLGTLSQRYGMPVELTESIYLNHNLLRCFSTACFVSSLTGFLTFVRYTDKFWEKKSEFTHSQLFLFGGSVLSGVLAVVPTMFVYSFLCVFVGFIAAIRVKSLVLFHAVPLLCFPLLLLFNGMFGFINLARNMGVMFCITIIQAVVMAVILKTNKTYWKSPQEPQDATGLQSRLRSGSVSTLTYATVFMPICFIPIDTSGVYVTMLVHGILWFIYALKQDISLLRIYAMIHSLLSVLISTTQSNSISAIFSIVASLVLIPMVLMHMASVGVFKICFPQTVEGNEVSEEISA